jgi:TrmH family RNA methyltransferase
MGGDPAIVLVAPRVPGNLGSIARAAKNFGIDDVRLVEPACEPDEEALRLASGADDLLAAMRRFPTLVDALADCDAVIATSSLRGRTERRWLTLGELPDYLAALGPAARVAYVFGRERSGLTEEERSRASATLTLPTSPSFPTMNLSHALVAVLAVHRAFEIGDRPRFSQARSRGSDVLENRGLSPEELAPSRELEAAVEHWDRALDAIGFYDTGHRGRSLRDWRRIVAGRPLTMREVAILRGVANRVLVSLRRSG